MPPLSRQRRLALTDDPWQPRELKVVLSNGTAVKVDARVLGSLAVYPKVDDAAQWVVAVTQLSLVVVSVATEGHAKRVGTHLWSKACLAFSEPTVAGLKARLPTWVAPWCRACTKAGKWLEP